MRTFLFSEKNGNANLTLFALNYNDALTYLADIVKDVDAWEVDDENGETE